MIYFLTALIAWLVPEVPGSIKFAIMREEHMGRMVLDDLVQQGGSSDPNLPQSCVAVAARCGGPAPLLIDSCCVPRPALMAATDVWCAPVANCP